MVCHMFGAGAAADVNGEVEMQGEEEEEGGNSRMHVTQQNHTEPAADINQADKDDAEDTPSISKLNGEDAKASKAKSATTTATHILCNGLEPAELNGQSGGEGQQLPKAEGAHTDSKVSLRGVGVIEGGQQEAGGDTPLPHPVTLTDAALPPHTPASQQGDSGFGSGFDLLRMDSQDDQTDIASPDGERDSYISVCFS